MKLTDSAKEDREKNIISAAVRVFALNGYNSSKVSDITTEAKIAYGLFYHYFECKDDLLIKIFQNAWRLLSNKIDIIMARTDDPVERLRQVLVYLFNSYKFDRNLLKVLIMDVPRLEKFYEKENLMLYKEPYNKISEIIEGGIKKGIFKKDISPVTLSQVIMGSVDSIIRHDVYDMVPGKKVKFNYSEAISSLHHIIIDSIKK